MFIGSGAFHFAKPSDLIPELFFSMSWTKLPNVVKRREPMFPERVCNVICFPWWRGARNDVNKPSVELQGRLPIRVELNALTVEDFVRILREPDASLTEQYTALLTTEGLDLQFSDDGLARIAQVAWEVNERTENIGARRLHTVLERLVEVISFEAPDRAGEVVTIDTTYVDEHLGELLTNDDLAKYIL